MQTKLMTLNISLPSGIFLEEKNISQIVAESDVGSFGILPQRLDCLASLVPGILIYRNKSHDEKFIAVDKGVLIKSGLNVHISVRSAVAGTGLKKLHEEVIQDFMNYSSQDKSVRKIMAKMESSFIQRLSKMRNE